MGDRPTGVKPRCGAVGQHGSIAIIERFVRSLKDERLRNYGRGEVCSEVSPEVWKSAPPPGEHTSDQTCKEVCPEVSSEVSMAAQVPEPVGNRAPRRSKNKSQPTADPRQLTLPLRGQDATDSLPAAPAESAPPIAPPSSTAPILPTIPEGWEPAAITLPGIGDILEPADVLELVRQPWAAASAELRQYLSDIGAADAWQDAAGQLTAIIASSRKKANGHAVLPEEPVMRPRSRRRAAAAAELS